MSGKKHDDIAKNISRKYNAEYNKGKGADIITSTKVIEVEPTAATISDAKRQLQGYRKERYIATSDKEVDKAVELTKNTKIGVMDSKGNIVKPAQKPKK